MYLPPKQPITAISMEFKMHGRHIGKVDNKLLTALRQLYPAITLRFHAIISWFHSSCIVLVYFQGSLCNDFCVTQCCTACVMCQLHRELNRVAVRR